MRLLFSKIHCPFICFCKPSAAHIYTTAPLKLESSPHVVPSGFTSVYKPSSEVEEDILNEKKKALKSCIRKPRDQEPVKKTVQWMDNIAEIKEFESSETGDTDNEEDSNRCLCIIL